MSNVISILRPYWRCLQHFNEIDHLVSLNKYLHRWDETHRRDVKFFEPEQTLTKTEQEKIKFYKTPTSEQKVLLDDEIERAIESTDLTVPENRLLDSSQISDIKSSSRSRKISGSESLLEAMVEHDTVIQPVLECLESIGSKKVMSLFKSYYII